VSKDVPVGTQVLTFSQVVKNPLSPIEHPGGLGVNNELFEEGLEQFVVRRISEAPQCKANKL
jgi:hypothetical protein